MKRKLTYQETRSSFSIKMNIDCSQFFYQQVTTLLCFLGDYPVNNLFLCFCQMFIFQVGYNIFLLFCLTLDLD